MFQTIIKSVISKLNIIHIVLRTIIWIIQNNNINNIKIIQVIQIVQITKWIQIIRIIKIIIKKRAAYKRKYLNLYRYTLYFIFLVSCFIATQNVISSMYMYVSTCKWVSVINYWCIWRAFIIQHLHLYWFLTWIIPRYTCSIAHVMWVFIHFPMVLFFLFQCDILCWFSLRKW